jgi:dynein heavy chain
MVKEWISLCRDTKIPVDADFTLQATLGNPVTIRQWQICGLPADEFR